MKLGDPPQYPLPEIDGNPFTLLLEPQREKDKARCEAWKDEVQNLLIFVSLASRTILKPDTIFARRLVFSRPSLRRSLLNHTRI